MPVNSSMGVTFGEALKRIVMVCPEKSATLDEGATGRELSFSNKDACFLRGFQERLPRGFRIPIALQHRQTCKGAPSGRPVLCEEATV